MCSAKTKKMMKFEPLQEGCETRGRIGEDGLQVACRRRTIVNCVLKNVHGFFLLSFDGCKHPTDTNTYTAERKEFKVKW
jgi:hypothetical protein